MWARLAAWPDQLHHWVIERIRTWLGINAQEQVLIAHTDFLMEMAMQGNDLAHALLDTRLSLDEGKTEAEKLKRRLLFYAEHCDSLSFAHRKFQRILEEERLREKEQDKEK